MEEWSDRRAHEADSAGRRSDFQQSAMPVNPSHESPNAIDVRRSQSLLRHLNHVLADHDADMIVFNGTHDDDIASLQRIGVRNGRKWRSWSEGITSRPDQLEPFRQLLHDQSAPASPNRVTLAIGNIEDINRKPGAAIKLENETDTIEAAFADPAAMMLPRGLRRDSTQGNLEVALP
jgi:hypothetical protein